MGLDKSNIRGIIHVDMPRTIESYLQEIGRGGRDGKTCYCHLILNDDNYLKLRSFICGTETVDFNSLKYIFQTIFKENNIEIQTFKCKKFGEKTNLKNETIMTLILHF